MNDIQTITDAWGSWFASHRRTSCTFTASTRSAIDETARPARRKIARMRSASAVGTIIIGRRVALARLVSREDARVHEERLTGP